MPNRLTPLDIVSFVGGLNLRRNSFQLGDDESPDMLNVDVDPRGGMSTRRGWQRWNADDIVDPEVVPWVPRNAFVHNLSSNTQVVYVANANKLYSAGSAAVFTELAGVAANASPHMVDFATWGDDIYLACGKGSPSYKRTGTAAPVALDPDNWSEVDAPISGVMPQAEYVEGHGGYLWCAVTTEADGNHYSRVRWSHPGKPDAWRQDDFLDIEIGGGKITGLQSFQDHLLIFKTNSLWALYGYDEDSWQLIKKSMSIGCPTITGTTRSETAVYFFSVSDRGGIYAYSGESPIYISEQIRPALEEVTAFERCYVSWAARRLWVTVPWKKGEGPTPLAETTFVFDVDVGNGAWTMYHNENGAATRAVDGYDVNARHALACFRSEKVACMVILDYIEEAYDSVLLPAVLGAPPPSDPVGMPFLSTSDGKDIGVSQPVGEPFESYYRTRWLHAGWPDRKKSWRRPTFVCRQVAQDVDLVVESYRDYDETEVHRSRLIHLKTGGSAYWTEGGADDPSNKGFDWKELGADSPDGRGADWGFERAGSTLQRAGSLGLARAVQLRLRASPNTPGLRWGIDGIVAKFVPRRFR